MDERKTSWLRRLMNNLLSCTREQRRDVVAYPPIPTPTHPSFRDGEPIVPPVDPPRRSKRKPLPTFEEVRTTQATELPEPFEYEWAPAPDVAGGSSQQQTPMYQTPHQQTPHRPIYQQAIGPSQQPPPPLVTPVGAWVKRHLRQVVERARQEAEGGGGRRGSRTSWRTRWRVRWGPK
ncbi:unnamed protein product [Linum trigynum]|uniref:Uncharacterized protein n=1 Tax=Linum trigynum TaxID=586398 RepID=A0AAV2CBT2_9ROSI